MPRFLARLLGQPKPKFNAKPGPGQRARDRQKIIATMRDMRFALKMEFK
jgi:hypothetical protein